MSVRNCQLFTRLECNRLILSWVDCFGFDSNAHNFSQLLIYLVHITCVFPCHWRVGLWHSDFSVCWAHEVEMGTGESVISNIDLDFGEVKVVLCLVMYSSQTCGHWPMDLMSSTLATYHSLLVFMCASPQREAGDVWCLPLVWNLRAVIWFHFAISSLVLLPSPVTLSFLSFSACWPFLLNFFQKILQYFSLRDRLFCMAPV